MKHGRRHASRAGRTRRREAKRARYSESRGGSSSKRARAARERARRGESGWGWGRGGGECAGSGKGTGEGRGRPGGFLPQGRAGGDFRTDRAAPPYPSPFPPRSSLPFPLHRIASPGYRPSPSPPLSPPLPPLHLSRRWRPARPLLRAPLRCCSPAPAFPRPLARLRFTRARAGGESLERSAAATVVRSSRWRT